jgi:acetyl-CoA C-acetyltransferase
MKSVYIVSAVRTPMGSFGGVFSEVPATHLGAAAIKGALARINLAPEEVKEVYMGCVLQAGLGQAPARQAAKFAGLPSSVQCTTINKVCASGMKAVSLAAQSIMLGLEEVVVAGGMENMSMVPHYMPGSRKGTKLGDIKMIDGLVFDGLTDVYNQYHMGNAAELCAKTYEFSREDQDNFAITSYQRSASAWNEGRFNAEIVPVEIKDRKGNSIWIDKDEEFTNVQFDKIPTLRPVFQKDGTITAANASTINDGASAIVLMSEEKVKALGIKPLAKIIGFADAEQEPEWFTTAPAIALPKAIQMAGISPEDVSYYELNEAFSVVGLVNIKLLNLDPNTVNVNGGAVSLGHPLGSSGSRILVTLLNVLNQNGAKYGAAGICNGGGGASAMVIERL